MGKQFHDRNGIKLEDINCISYDEQGRAWTGEFKTVPGYERKYPTGKWLRVPKLDSARHRKGSEVK